LTEGYTSEIVDEEEFFLPFDEFPWFKDAPLQAILNVQRHGSEHLHWPALDVDLTLNSIRYPEHYPLVSQVNPKASVEPESAGDSSR